MEPLTFDPILKRAVWGGRNLGDLLGKPLANDPDYAESWEVSDLPDNVSIVDQGPMKARSLRQLMEQDRVPLLGRHADTDRFPLLIKFLDAHRDLSVQVHPSRAMAARRPEVTTGKAESWVILAAAPGSRIYAGLKPGVDRPQLEAAIVAGTVVDCLHICEVKPGDCFFLKPGTVHALGAGIVVAEIQQPNAVTYRLYDWGRMGTDGKPRELHIDLGLEAADFESGPIHAVTPQPFGTSGHAEHLVETEFFCIDRCYGGSTISIPGDNRMHVLMVLDGSIRSSDGTYEYSRGTTVVIPAACEQRTWEPSASAILLDSYLP